MKKGLRKQPKVKAAGIKINKKYTNSDSGQKTRMAKEVIKFKGKSSNEVYKGVWAGDSVGGDKKTRYKTKESKYTKKFREKFGK